MIRRPAVLIGIGVLLAGTACGQGAPAATRPAAAETVRPAAGTPGTAPTPQPPAPTPSAAPPTPTPAPRATDPPAPAPGISVVTAPGSVRVSVTGIAPGAHQVHVHTDCSGNPNLHLTTLGTLFAGTDGAATQTFSLPASLRGHGYDLLVYPLGASQGPPSLCAAV